jgi:hypothetical protein
MREKKIFFLLNFNKKINLFVVIFSVFSSDNWINDNIKNDVMKILFDMKCMHVQPWKSIQQTIDEKHQLAYS